MTQSAYAYPVPAGLAVISSFRVPGHEDPIGKVACSCCGLSTPVTPTSTVEKKHVTCSYCRRVCKDGHVSCKGCCGAGSS